MEPFFILIGVFTCIAAVVFVAATCAQVWTSWPGSIPDEIERLRKSTFDRIAHIEARISELEKPHDETR